MLNEAPLELDLNLNNASYHSLIEQIKHSNWFRRVHLSKYNAYAFIELICGIDSRLVKVAFGKWSGSAFCGRNKSTKLDVVVLL